MCMIWSTAESIGLKQRNTSFSDVGLSSAPMTNQHIGKNTYVGVVWHFCCEAPVNNDQTSELVTD